MNESAKVAALHSAALLLRDYADAVGLLERARVAGGVTIDVRAGAGSPDRCDPLGQGQAVALTEEMRTAVHGMVLGLLEKRVGDVREALHRFGIDPSRIEPQAERLSPAEVIARARAAYQGAPSYSDPEG
jgi:hypothetical protein